VSVNGTKPNAVLIDDFDESWSLKDLQEVRARNMGLRKSPTSREKRRAAQFGYPEWIIDLSRELP